VKGAFATPKEKERKTDHTCYFSHL